MDGFLNTLINEIQTNGKANSDKVMYVQAAVVISCFVLKPCVMYLIKAITKDPTPMSELRSFNADNQQTIDDVEDVEDVDEPVIVVQNVEP